MAFKVEQEITEEAIDNVLCAALDPGYGGAYYWCNARRNPENPANGAKYLHEVPLKGGSIIITISGDNDDPDNGKRYNLDLWAIEEGLKKMAKDPAGQRVLANIIADNTDADDGDALIQFCVLGELIYG